MKFRVLRRRVCSQRFRKMPARFDTVHFADLNVSCEQTLDSTLNPSDCLVAAVSTPMVSRSPLLDEG